MGVLGDQATPPRDPRSLPHLVCPLCLPASPKPIPLSRPTLASQLPLPPSQVLFPPPHPSHFQACSDNLKYSSPAPRPQWPAHPPPQPGHRQVLLGMHGEWGPLQLVGGPQWLSGSRPSGHGPEHGPRAANYGLGTCLATPYALYWLWFVTLVIFVKTIN